MTSEEYAKHLNAAAISLQVASCQHHEACEQEAEAVAALSAP